MGQMRKGLGREVWKRHLEACRTSGVAQSEYCRRHGLTESAFQYWKQRLAIETETRQPEFVEIPLATSEPSFQVTIDRTGLIRLQIDIAALWGRR